MSEILDLAILYSWTALKWAVIIVLALNWESIPGIWHARVFWTMGLWLLRRLPVQFIPSKKRDFLYKRMPIGQSPFDYTVTYSTVCGFADTDYNLHLSNSSYAKIFDLARMRAFVKWFPLGLLNGTLLGLGASHFHFIKEIPLGSRYEIRVNIVAWEEKWIHLVAQFVTYPKPARQGAARTTSQPLSREDSAASVSSSSTTPAPPTPSSLRSRKSNSRTKVSFSSPPSSSPSSDGEEDDIFHRSSVNSTPATSAGSTSPTMKGSGGLGAVGLSAAASSLADQVDEASAMGGFDLKSLPPLPEGAVLNCVHVSSYCFKQGRMTIPPRVALTTAGFGDPARAERITQITNTSTRNPTYRTVGAPLPEKTYTVSELMRGDWKRFESEGLWDLPEYEERNRTALERFRPLRLALDTLRL
ncbi:hypothetical protein DL93DRAFT_2164493 [Clavulina sp. PMI_390]|nr:hypothetical protein DL93DRAFT_2164493 [Clavulina sp. PMI_390]